MANKRPTARSRTAAPKPTASEVGDGVFVGGWNDATKFRGTRICVLDESPEGEVPAEVQIPIYDPANDRPIRANLERVAARAKEARGRGEPVLFFCGHGVRRGPLAAAWYLHRQERVSLSTAYDRIRAVRPNVETPEKWIGDPSNLNDDPPVDGR
jgi:hypothetical protein